MQAIQRGPSHHAQQQFLKALESTSWVVERVGCDLHQLLDYILSPVVAEEYQFSPKHETFIATFSKQDIANYTDHLVEAITQFKDMLRLCLDILRSSGASNIDASSLLLIIARIHSIGTHSMPRYETDESRTLLNHLPELRISANMFLSGLIERSRCLPVTCPFVTSAVLPRVIQNGMKSISERKSMYSCIRAMAQQNGDITELMHLILKQALQDIQDWSRPMFDPPVLQKSRKLESFTEMEPAKTRVDENLIHHELFAAALSVISTLLHMVNENCKSQLHEIIYSVTNAGISLIYVGCNEEYGYELCRVVIYEFVSHICQCISQSELAAFLPIWHKLFSVGIHDPNSNIQRLSKNALESFEILIHPRQPITREPSLKIPSSQSNQAIPTFEKETNEDKGIFYNDPLKTQDFFVIKSQLMQSKTVSDFTRRDDVISTKELPTSTPIRPHQPQNPKIEFSIAKDSDSRRSTSNPAIGERMEAAPKIAVASNDNKQSQSISANHDKLQIKSPPSDFVVKVAEETINVDPDDNEDEEMGNQSVEEATDEEEEEEFPDINLSDGESLVDDE